MPESSEQEQRLLRADFDADRPYQWKEGEEDRDDDDEEQAQWPPASRKPPSRWRRCTRLVRRCMAPVWTLLSALSVVSVLYLLLTNSSLSIPTYSASTHAPDDPIIYLHPEDHIHRDPQVIHLAWNITKARLAPDGVFRDVILINGAFPGPTVECRTGDTVVVAVTNSLEDEPIAFHWHGLHMHGANHMDGPVGVNQCAIPAQGGTFVYEVPTGDQAGTFWYHAHSELQRADGMWGGFVVHRPDAPTVPEVKGGAGVPSHGDVSLGSDTGGYDRDILLLLGDWYHFSGQTIYSIFQDPTSNGNEPCPGSVLLNGQGAYDCRLAPPAAPVDCHAVELPSLTLDKTLRYRVRVVNVGVLTGVSTTVPDGEMEVLSVDGGLPVVVPEGAPGAPGPRVNSVGVIYPAQRVDYILSWPDADVATDTELVVTVDDEYYALVLQDPPSRTFAIKAAPPKTWVNRTPSEHSATPAAVNLREVTGPSLPSALPAPDQKYMIFAVVEILSHNHFVPKGYINHTMWVPQQDAPLLALDRSAWDAHQLVPWTGRAPAWVELTINNIDTQGHPFHLHGFDFYVVGSHEGLGGWDYYNPFLSKPPRGGPVNVDSPLNRDTVYVPPYGYVILRFRADNEGLWVLHCHILWHQASGMSMAFQVGGFTEHGFGGTPPSLRAAEYCRTRNERHKGGRGSQTDGSGGGLE